MIPRIPTQWRYARASYMILGLCCVAYILLNLFSPNSTASRLYHLSTLQLGLLQLTVVVPMIIIWAIALWGAVAVKSYAIIIRDTPESRGLSLIADGLLWLLIYLLTLSLSGTILPYFAHSPWINALAVIRNHLPVISSLLGFGLLCLGTYRLQHSAPFPVWTKTTAVLFSGLGLLAGLFAWLYLTTEMPPPTNGIPIYGLPKQVLLFTLVMPYCWAWLLGLLAAGNLIKYSRRVKGVLYRKALRDLAWGAASAVTMVVSVQFITLSSRFLTKLQLGYLLLTVYGLLAICAMGFLFIRSGARKLTRIEAVQ
jgi:hypothetical protein